MQVGHSPQEQRWRNDPYNPRAHRKRMDVRAGQEVGPHQP